MLLTNSPVISVYQCKTQYIISLPVSPTVSQSGLSVIQDIRVSQSVSPSVLSPASIAVLRYVYNIMIILINVNESFIDTNMHCCVIFQESAKNHTT